MFFEEKKKKKKKEYIVTLQLRFLGKDERNNKCLNFNSIYLFVQVFQCKFFEWNKIGESCPSTPKLLIHLKHYFWYMMIQIN